MNNDVKKKNLIDNVEFNFKKNNIHPIFIL